MSNISRMQAPITLVRPAQTMLAMRYGGPGKNLEQFLAFIKDAPFKIPVTMAGDSIIIRDASGFPIRHFGPEMNTIAQGTWAIIDDANRELILATDEVVLSMFTHLAN